MLKIIVNFDRPTTVPSVFNVQSIDLFFRTFEILSLLQKVFFEPKKYIIVKPLVSSLLIKI